MQKLKILWLNDPFFLLLLFASVLTLFHRAFSIGFFIDDFFFLNIGQAQNPGEFVRFFLPFKSYFYRPVPTEFFYFLIRLSGNNLALAHAAVFSIFFAGLYFLYRVLIKTTGNFVLSRTAVMFYALSFVHVFQLYQLATFIEVCLFVFLAASFYFWLEKKILLSAIFFIVALMSKETAALFPLFLVLYEFFIHRKKTGRSKVHLILFAGLSVLFILIYRYGVESVTAIETYKIKPDIRLAVNNLMWYGLWSAGLPNFMPDYFTSILSPPLPKFWQYLRERTFLIYAISYLSFLVLLISPAYSLIKKYRKRLLQIIFLTASFFLFVSPTLPIVHRWMVRLTVPLIFVSIAEAYLVCRLFKIKKFGHILGPMAVALYLIWNCQSVFLHENTSTYLLESSISARAGQYFSLHKKDITGRKYIYFIDAPEDKGNPWKNSEKLKVTFHDQSFIDFYFPGSRLKAVYGYQVKNPPPDSFVIDSSLFLD